MGTRARVDARSESQVNGIAKYDSDRVERLCDMGLEVWTWTYQWTTRRTMIGWMMMGQ